MDGASGLPASNIVPVCRIDTRSDLTLRCFITYLTLRQPYQYPIIVGEALLHIDIRHDDETEQELSIAIVVIHTTPPSSRQRQLAIC
jgi:hypothetical protein